MMLGQPWEFPLHPSPVGDPANSDDMSQDGLAQLNPLALPA